jgi:HEAT repeat protein
MKSFKDLIQDLKSTDPAIRDKAALDLMDIGNDEAVPYLIEAIRAPGNENYRGTLVYSLSGYNCGEYLEYLVDLCLKANFEVSSNAFNIIEEIKPKQTTASRIKAHLANYDSDELPYEHGVDAFNALSDIVKKALV